MIKTLISIVFSYCGIYGDVTGMLQKYRALQFIHAEVVDLQNVYISHGKNDTLIEILGTSNLDI